MWHWKLLDKISKAWELGVCWVSLIHLKIAACTYEEKPHPKKKAHQDAVNITDFLIIVYCDIPAVYEEVQPQVLCHENKGEMVLSYISFTLKDHLHWGPRKAKQFDFQPFGPKKGWICARKLSLPILILQDSRC